MPCPWTISLQWYLCKECPNFQVSPQSNFINPRLTGVYSITQLTGGLFEPPPLLSPKLLDRFSKLKRRLIATANLSKETKLRWPRGHRWPYRSGQSQIVYDYCIFILGALVAPTRIEMSLVLLKSLKNGRWRVLCVHKAYYRYVWGQG